MSEQNIVTRLRITHFLDGRELGMTAQRAEAADEIERLRRELAAMRRAATELCKHVEPEEVARIVDLHPILEAAAAAGGE